MATLSHVQFEFNDPNGFQPGEVKTKNLILPTHDQDNYRFTAIAATAAPFHASNQNRQLKVRNVAIRARNPNPPSNDHSIVRVTVESVGPDAPTLWYLSLSLVVP